ncbi:MAG: hypothetical protein U1A07_16000 [Phenylobacterium sp.]|uniref:hypothetical protein n=1 Tax=Brevundimonas sp. TaxID=1871086 RepID=UPI002ABB533B|nr:hypothetical protein [Brevundimonas sp.]MDZ4320317.1 hypothetical protein [Phenylobacterium sp.]
MRNPLRGELSFTVAAISLIVALSGAGPSALAQEAATVTGRVTNAQGGPETARSMGGPITGIPVGLEGDPEGRVVASGATDERGVVQLRQPPPGRYRVYMDTSSLVGPVRVHVSIPGSPAAVSQTIAPRPGGGRAYVSATGRRASLFDIGRTAPRGPITVQIEAVNDAP